MMSLPLAFRLSVTDIYHRCVLLDEAPFLDLERQVLSRTVFFATGTK